jgi:hypothetical protein
MEDKVQSAYDFLNQPENKHLKEFVKTFKQPNGFAFCVSPEYKEIMDALDDDGHSGSSLAMCMRSCQRLFNLEAQHSV